MSMTSLLTLLLLSVPTYASACSGSLRYSSACSCIGVNPPCSLDSQATLPITEYSSYPCESSGISKVTSITNGECLHWGGGGIVVAVGSLISSSCTASDCQIVLYENGDTNCAAENDVGGFALTSIPSCDYFSPDVSSIKLVCS